MLCVDVWFHRFKESLITAECDKHHGHPSASRRDELVVPLHDSV
jgi:hypothetical protein